MLDNIILNNGITFLTPLRSGSYLCHITNYISLNIICNNKHNYCVGNVYIQIMTDGSCSHTNSGDVNAWWQVDLGQIVHVTLVIIYNRGDNVGMKFTGRNSPE